jgi:Tfp pilus assembly protein PilN
VSADTKTRTLADLPHVNLLPPEIGERKRLQQVQVGGVAILLAAVGVVAALYVTGASDVTKAKQAKATAVAENTTLTAKAASFSTLRQVQSSLSAHEAMLTQATSSEILWSSYFGSFATLPTSTWLTSMTLSENIGPGSLTSTKDAPILVGSASFSGIGLKYGSLADWLDKMATIGNGVGFLNATFSTASESYIDSTKVVNFAGTVTLTPASLAGRCATPGKC